MFENFELAVFGINSNRNKNPISEISVKSQFYPFCTESPVCHRVIILSQSLRKPSCK